MSLEHIPFNPAWLCLIAPALLCVAALFLEGASIAMSETAPWWTLVFMACAPLTIIFWLLAGANAAGCGLFLWRLL